MTRIVTIIIVGFFIFKFVNNFFYIDPINGCFIKILPSWDFNFNQATIKEGLDVLKNGSPDDYKNVCKRISTIDPNLACGGADGGCHWPGDPTRISVSSSSNIPINVVAAVIVHETCHSKQDSEHRPFSEAECQIEDDRVLRSISIY